MISKKAKKEIGNLYSWHKYEIEPKEVNEICLIFEKLHTRITDEEIIKFLFAVKSGKYGMLYKAPTSLTSMFYKHFKIGENKNPPEQGKEFLLDRESLLK